MGRRGFIGSVAGALLAVALAARPQQSNRLRRIGVLIAFAKNDEAWQADLASFRQRLQDLGWIEGRNVRFDYQFPGENTERIRVAAAELVALAPDVIFVCAFR